MNDIQTRPYSCKPVSLTFNLPCPRFSCPNSDSLMQTTSNSYHPWTSSNTHFFTTPVKHFKTPHKPLNLSYSLKASFEFQDNKLDIRVNPIIPARLPIIIRQSGSVFQYSWDGKQLKLVSLDESSSISSSFDDLEDGYKRLFGICSSVIRNFLLPREISGNYVEYVKWKFLHRVFSSALQVLATQAMFRAIGIGFSRSLPSAAALNWVLKDGLGRLSRCIYTASLASAFDTNLKRVRFSTSVVFSLSVGLELLTPVFPQYFLLLASVANIAKQISLACYLATSSAVHRSFALADNLGEVSAKAQIQSVSFDNLGLLLAASLNMLFRNSPRLQAGLPFAIYPIFTAVDLFGIYQGLKHVHLQTLTKDRLEIILNTWINLGYVPSPAEVSNVEGIGFLSGRGKEFWEIRMGCLNTKSQIPKLSMMTMQSLSNEDFYFVCMEISWQRLSGTGQLGILLCLREGADTAHVILSLLQACYIRKRLQCSATKWENMIEGKSDLELSDWFKLVEDSKQSALEDINLLNEKVLEVGWASKNILLSTKEQTRYSFVDDERIR